MSAATGSPGYSGFVLWKYHSTSNLQVMGGPRGYHAQSSKSYRKRQILYNSIYIWNLKNKTKPNRHQLIDTENKLMVARWEGNRGVKGITMYKLPVIKLVGWDAIYSIDNIVSNIVISVYGDRWFLDLS